MTVSRALPGGALALRASCIGLIDPHEHRVPTTFAGWETDHCSGRRHRRAAGLRHRRWTAGSQSTPPSTVSVTREEGMSHRPWHCHGGHKSVCWVLR